MFERWELSLSEDAWQELIEAEEMVIEDEELINAYYINKLIHMKRLSNKKTHKAKDKVKTMNYQHKADRYKKDCKKKNYSLKHKGITQKASVIVPPDALGWDKININIMGTKIYGIKVGAIWDMT